MQTFSRLVGCVSLLGPMELAPLFFSAAALFAQILPIVYLLSRRLNRYPFIARLFLVVSYALLTNTADTYLNVTNSQWYLALTMFLVIAAQPAELLIWKIIDFCVLFAAGLTGPFAILLLLPAFLLAHKKKLPINSMQFQVISFTTAVQALILFFNGAQSGQRLYSGSGFTLLDMYSIYYRQILWGVIAGPLGYDWIVKVIPFSQEFFFITTVMSFVILGYALWRARPELKALIVFAVFIFTTSLIAPSVAADAARTVYQVMFDASGIRYWLLPMICVLVIIIWGVSVKNVYVRSCSLFFIAALVFFTLKLMVHPSRLIYPAYVDYLWQEEVAEFESLPPGSSKTFQINPTGWQMILVKK